MILKLLIFLNTANAVSKEFPKLLVSFFNNVFQLPTTGYYPPPGQRPSEGLRHRICHRINEQTVQTEQCALHFILQQKPYIYEWYDRLNSK
jgi:hypothetical protein